MDKELKKLLSLKPCKAGKKSPSFNPRSHNINWIKDLDRENLKYNRVESQILIHTTKMKEAIYIQYPGKESTQRTLRTWDFRPRICLHNGQYHKNLTFGDIWEAIFINSNKVPKTDR